MFKLLALKTLGISLIAFAGLLASPKAEAQRRGGDNWIFCANEGEICRVYGRTQVAYGARGYFVYGTANGSFRCDNRTFGRDPIRGVRKQCFVQQTRRDDPGRGGQWRFCANEGAICRVPGDAIVRYGANGYFNQMRVRNWITCDNRNFGDPIPGVQKYCQYRLRY